MGQLSKSLVKWVQAMNRPARTQQARHQRDQDIKEAFDGITEAGLGPESKWDKGDRLAWDILSAFGRAESEATKKTKRRS